MPGLYIESPPSKRNSRSVSRSLYGLPSERETVSFSDERVRISLSAYDGYPHLVADKSDLLIILEGLVYNKTDSEIVSSLESINACSDQDKIANDVRSLIETWDGEFVALSYCKTSGKLILFNDRWGRLPLYVYSGATGIVVSRGLGRIVESISGLSFDSLGMAQFLSFQHTIGKRTLFEEVDLIPPATLLCFCNSPSGANSTRSLTRTCLKPIEFPEKFEIIDRRSAVEETLRVFHESLSNRVNKLREKGLELTCDLSGGLDSRLVFAGLSSVGAKFTSCHDSLYTGDESEISERVAESFGKKLRKFRASHPFENIVALEDIVFLTDCAVNCKTALGSFFDDAERRKGFDNPVANFMGFGGEWLRNSNFRTYGYGTGRRAVINDSLTKFLPVKVSCALTGVSPERFSASLDELTASFPDGSKNAISSNSLGRAFYYEFHRTLVSSGEENTRRFFWTVSPLSSLELLRLTHQRIDPRLMGIGIFVEVLGRIDNRALMVPLFGSGIRLNSSLSVRIHSAGRDLRNFARSTRLLYNSVKAIKERLHNMKSAAGLARKNLIASHIEASLESNSFLAKTLNSDQVRNCLRGSVNLSSLYQLLTLVSFVRQISSQQKAN